MNVTGKIQKELLSLAAKHGGKVTPEQIVAFAENPETALHSRFCWDDNEAAKRFRILQAERILRVTVFVEPRTEKTVRVFLSLPDDRAKSGAYRRTVDVLSDAQMRRQMLNAAIAELAAFQKKYAAFQELSAVFAAIRTVAKKSKRLSA